MTRKNAPLYPLPDHRLESAVGHCLALSGADQMGSDRMSTAKLATFLCLFYGLLIANSYLW